MTYLSGEPTIRRRGPARLAGLAVSAMVVLFSLPAFSQDVNLKPLLDRIQRLERDVRTLNAQPSRSGGQPAPLVSGPTDLADVPGAQQTIARMEVRLTALEAEVRDATGRAEEVSHQIDEINQRLDKLIGDVDYRLSVLERGQAAQPSGTGQPGAPAVAAIPAPPSVERSGPGQAVPAPTNRPGTLGTLSGQDVQQLEQGGTPPASETASAPENAPAGQAGTGPAGVLPEGTPREQYTYAFDLLRQTRYDEAAAALSAFLDRHGDDPLAENARYWLGETYYVRADYVKAAEIFLGAYQDNPKGGKAPDTLLKLGMSLANLNKKQEACAAFGKLQTDYPDAPANIKRLVDRERSKYACN